MVDNQDINKWPKKIIQEGIKICHAINFDDSITPPKKDVLNFLKIDPATIKVVILGQDPYPSFGVANGFAFAVNSYAPIPKSLQNIFKEIKEVQGKVVTDRTLKHWINQGVLLLNTSLTTVVNHSNSHQHLWKDFTIEVIKWIDQNYKVIWVLWGNEAKKYIPIIKNKYIQDGHPSPLSIQYRKKNTFHELQEILDISW